MDYRYTFTINGRQHRVLEDLAMNHPQAVYYVFPLYSTWSKAKRDAPHLMRDTWLVPVSCVSLDPSTSQSTYTINLARVNSRISVTGRSVETTCEAVNAWELFVEERAAQSLDSRIFSVEAGQLREWIDQWEESGLRFRRLNALYVPY